MSSQEFANQVTRIEPEWANDVNDLVYDVFGAAKSVADARASLQLGTMALQARSAVDITGGTVNGVSIGNTVPGPGVFSTLKSNLVVPVQAADVVVLSYLNTRLSAYTTLATMNPAAVAFTGGTINGVTINGGSVDGAPVGAANPNTGRFTSLAVENAIPVSSGGTGSESFSGKYLTYVALPTPHLESVNQIPAADVLGLGSMAFQQSTSVTITGGSLDNVTVGAGATFEGLGSLAEQDANAVAITGGTLENVTLIGVTFSLALQSASGTATVDPAKDLLMLTAGVTPYFVDLPDPALLTRPLYVKKVGATRVDLRAPAGKSIDGANVYSLFNDRESLLLLSDGTNFFVF